MLKRDVFEYFMPYAKANIDFTLPRLNFKRAEYGAKYGRLKDQAMEL